jgi:hypothetical protein
LTDAPSPLRTSLAGQLTTPDKLSAQVNCTVTALLY